MMIIKQWLLVIYWFQELENLVGGSQREERYDVLERIMDEKGMSKDGLQWYMDLRRYGGCKHAGFGLGFDRFLMYLTGMQIFVMLNLSQEHQEILKFLTKKGPIFYIGFCFEWVIIIDKEAIK